MVETADVSAQQRTKAPKRNASANPASSLVALDRAGYERVPDDEDWPWGAVQAWPDDCLEWPDD